MTTPAPIKVNGRIVFNLHDPVSDTGTTYTVAADGSDKQQVTGGEVTCTGWSPRGDLLICTRWLETGARPAWAKPDGSGLQYIDIDAYAGRSLQCAYLDASRFVCELHEIDGVAPPPDRGLVVIDATDGHIEKQLTLFPEGCGDTDLAPSPDGHAILFNRVCNDLGTLFVIRDDATGMTHLSPSEVNAEEFYGSLSAGWSPDGEWICFAAFIPKADSPALYVVRPDGSDLRQIVAPSLSAITAQWSPDGSLIAFNSRLRSRPQIWTVRPDGTDLRKVTSGADGTTAVAPVWSPDGTRLLYARLTAGGVELWSMNVDGSDAEFVVDLHNPESISYAWGASAK